MKAEKTILILGAGRSSSSLIQALLEKAEASQWKVAVGDMDVEMAQSKCYGHPCAEWFEIDSKDPTDRNDRIAKADLVKREQSRKNIHQQFSKARSTWTLKKG